MKLFIYYLSIIIDGVSISKDSDIHPNRLDVARVGLDHDSQGELSLRVVNLMHSCLLELLPDLIQASERAVDRNGPDFLAVLFPDFLEHLL